MPKFINTLSNDAGSNARHVMSLPNELSLLNKTIRIQVEKYIVRESYFTSIFRMLPFLQMEFIIVPIIDLLFSIVLLWLFDVWEK